MRNKLISSAALTLVLASATGASAQTDKYDITGGEHMYSYGAQQPSAAPSPKRAARRTDVNPASPAQWQSNVQYDHTGDHMYSYGPASK
jgi:hypothetical protein